MLSANKLAAWLEDWTAFNEVVDTCVVSTWLVVALSLLSVLSWVLTSDFALELELFSLFDWLDEAESTFSSVLVVCSWELTALACSNFSWLELELELISVTLVLVDSSVSALAIDVCPTKNNVVPIKTDTNPTFNLRKAKCCCSLSATFCMRIFILFFENI